MYSVLVEGAAATSVFTHPMAAISRALCLSMESPETFRVLAGEATACLARDGALFTEDGCEISPTEAVRVAERMLGRRSTPIKLP